MLLLFFVETAHRQVARKLRASEARRHICLIPETGLPPVIKPTGEKGGKLFFIYMIRQF